MPKLEVPHETGWPAFDLLPLAPSPLESGSAPSAAASSLLVGRPLRLARLQLLRRAKRPSAEIPGAEVIRI